MSSVAQKTQVQNLVAGRIVLYVLPSGPRKGEIRAAVVSLVPATAAGPPTTVNLSVFKGQGNDFVDHDWRNATALTPNVAYDPDGAPGTWHWPDRAGGLAMTVGAPALGIAETGDADEAPTEKAPGT